MVLLINLYSKFKWGTLVFLVGLTILFQSQWLQAASFCVETLSDPVTADASRCDNTCTAGGMCSFRDAIEAVNAEAVDSSNLILFQMGLAGDINLIATLPTVTRNLDIIGPGPETININGYSDGDPTTYEGSILSFNGSNPGRDYIVRGLSLTGGSSNNGGGAIQIATTGALDVTDSLTLSNMAFFNNISRIGGGAVSFIGSDLTITDSEFVGNTANNSGASTARGGAINIVAETASIDTLRSALISKSTFSGNFAKEGGAIALSGVSGCSPTAEVSIVNTTISGNRSRYQGSGIVVPIRCPMNLVNVTLVNNQSLNERPTATGRGLGAAGIDAVDSFDANKGEVNLFNTIIANNQYQESDGSFTTLNCDGFDGVGTPSPSPRIIFNTFGHNLVDNPSDVTHCGLDTSAMDLMGDPLLSALSDHGLFLRESHAPLPGSPAIDAIMGDCTYSTTSTPSIRVGEDTNSTLRNLDGDGDSTSDCDIGAYERGRCGDGRVEAGEECDDGNTDNTDSCLNTCVAATCGDGFEQAGVEACDDGNRDDEMDCPYGAMSCTACAADCSAVIMPTPHFCGDSTTDTADGEACDDGNRDDEVECPYGTASCTNFCAGDCSSNLTLSGRFCGDGTTDAADGEACDDGNTADEVECPYGIASCTDFCAGDCSGNLTLTGRFCGDGTLDADDGEACDDGNTDPDDGCNASCEVEADWSCAGTPTSVCQRCGNGTREGTEVCDDGNTEDETDCPYGETSCTGCSATCETSLSPTPHFCGDGILDEDEGETCDEGASLPSATCDSTCHTVEPGASYCGDGVVDASLGEECDDADLDDSDGCDRYCHRVEIPEPSSEEFGIRGGGCSLRKTHQSPHGFVYGLFAFLLLAYIPYRWRKLSSQRF